MSGVPDRVTTQVWNSQIRRANWQTSCLWSFAYIYIYIWYDMYWYVTYTCVIMCVSSLAIYLSIYLSIDRSIDLSIYRSIDRSIYLSIYLYMYMHILAHTHTPIRWYSTFSQLHRWSQWVTAPLSGWTFPWHLWQMSWRTENLSSDRCSVGKAETDADNL